jgi:hypothetical protein
MNRSDFINLLEDKVQINRQVIREVYELIDIFPYFQSAHMLILKGLKYNADVKFGKQLKNSAFHIADREVLYYQLIRQPEENIRGEEASQPPDRTEENNADHQQTVIESAKNSEQLISEIEKNSAYLNEQPADSQLLHGHSILISSESEAPESEEVIMVMDEENGNDEDRVFYMDPGFSVPDYSDLLELDTSQENIITDEEKETITDQPAADAGRKKNVLQSELIDKFIQANPRIAPVRDPLSLPSGDLAKAFAEKEGGFVTETLARIYINQGYYSKAIDIYNELSLKFPEKSSYFASQIEMVKVYLKK